MELSDDEKRKAIEAAKGIKDAAHTESLEAKNETIREMEDGAPRTPGYQPHYGQTMKPAPGEASREQAQATPTESNAFEQALAQLLKETTPASPDKPHDIDR